MGILLVIVNHFLFEKLISLFLKSESGGKKLETVLCLYEGLFDNRFVSISYCWVD